MQSRWKGEALRSISDRIWTQKVEQPRGGSCSDQHLHISHQIMWRTRGSRITQTVLSSTYFCLCFRLSCSLSLSWSLCCFFMQVHNWPVGPLGLLYDRSWMVVNGNGVCLSQKRVQRLCLIRPQVHLPSDKLLLQAPGQTVCQRLAEFTHTA